MRLHAYLAAKGLSGVRFTTLRSAQGLMLRHRLQLQAAVGHCAIRQCPLFRPCGQGRRTVRCAVSKSQSPSRRQQKGAGSKGGFGKSKNTRPALEPWEEDLAPSYRVYYKPTFKPGKFLGPVIFKRDSGENSTLRNNSKVATQLRFSKQLHPMELGGCIQHSSCCGNDRR